jgi:hypothetical protein
MWLLFVHMGHGGAGVQAQRRARGAAAAARRILSAHARRAAGRSAQASAAVCVGLCVCVFFCRLVLTMGGEHRAVDGWWAVTVTKERAGPYFADAGHARAGPGQGACRARPTRPAVLCSAAVMLTPKRHGYQTPVRRSAITCIRVRFPDGRILQARFAVREPVSAIHAVVQQCLAQPDPYVSPTHAHVHPHIHTHVDTRIATSLLCPS